MPEQTTPTENFVGCCKVGQRACRPRATARNAVRDWNSVTILLEGKAGGFATSEEFLCHV